ncbi:N-acetylglucosamine-1-phosphate uridyltransferase / Glucosamine-1-phosphate N-acetyltransferase [hydrothermal vent metagenome]|uniref:N-acetylglucosamine-1-phosphate uridyltransferase / Glucosamine-1-phosphate N-acetyltransferase n=1 Tax=hydrothermal vent metagenome TaxID=652676 RepID=A0A3B0QRY1_9ZZZZ
MKNVMAIVLAAGKGTRMKSKLPKMLHPVSGKPMIFYPVRALKELKVERTVVVVGHSSEQVRAALPDKHVSFCEQSPQLGTGHAVMCAISELTGLAVSKGEVLILSGDVPLITKNTLKALLRIHRRSTKGVKGRAVEHPVISFISVLMDDPTGYGRVVRDNHDRVCAIVEDKDLAPPQRSICEVNTGIYLIDFAFLKTNLKKLSTKNKQKEYYLPDLISLAYSQGKRVKAFTHLDPEEVMGINNRLELARAGMFMRERINEEHMLAGVSFIDPSTAYIDYGVKIGEDVAIYPNVHLGGATVVGEGSVIEEGVKIKDSRVGIGAVIKSHSVIESSVLGDDVQAGPFARLRPGTRVKRGVRIGNFVEVKNATLGEGVKAGHLSYLGDAVIGKDVNIGAGTIICNYDGVDKHKTHIKDNVFVGSDTQLISPVTIGKGAYIGSGSTITKNVPPGALALSRSEQRVIKGWAAKRAKTVSRKKTKG